MAQKAKLKEEMAELEDGNAGLEDEVAGLEEQKVQLETEKAILEEQQAKLEDQKAKVEEQKASVDLQVRSMLLPSAHDNFDSLALGACNCSAVCTHARAVTIATPAGFAAQCFLAPSQSQPESVLLRRTSLLSCT